MEKTEKFYAKHTELSVSGGFGTAQQRDDYVALSISNGHSWIACSEEEAIKCDVYQTHYLEERQRENIQIFMRLGTTLNLPKEQALKVLSGDREALLKTLLTPNETNGTWLINEETYIPEPFPYEECSQYLSHDMEFDLPRLSVTGISVIEFHDEKNIKIDEKDVKELGDDYLRYEDGLREKLNSLKEQLGDEYEFSGNLTTEQFKKSPEPFYMRIGDVALRSITYYNEVEKTTVCDFYFDVRQGNGEFDNYIKEDMRGSFIIHDDDDIRAFCPDMEINMFCIIDSYVTEFGLEYSKTADMLNEKSDHIEVNGHTGTWYVVDTMKDDVNNRTLFLLEHEEFGDDTACVIVDGSGKIVQEDVWNGFYDYEESLSVVPDFSDNTIHFKHNESGRIVSVESPILIKEYQNNPKFHEFGRGNIAVISEQKDKAQENIKKTAPLPDGFHFLSVSLSDVDKLKPHIVGFVKDRDNPKKAVIKMEKSELPKIKAILSKGNSIAR